MKGIKEITIKLTDKEYYQYVKKGQLESGNMIIEGGRRKLRKHKKVLLVVIF
jgi:hypothetical protein